MYVIRMVVEWNGRNFRPHYARTQHIRVTFDLEYPQGHGVQSPSVFFSKIAFLKATSPTVVGCIPNKFSGWFSVGLHIRLLSGILQVLGWVKVRFFGHSNAIFQLGLVLMLLAFTSVLSNTTCTNCASGSLGTFFFPRLNGRPPKWSLLVSYF